MGKVMHVDGENKITHHGAPLSEHGDVGLQTSETFQSAIWNQTMYNSNQPNETTNNQTMYNNNQPNGTTNNKANHEQQKAA